MQKRGESFIQQKSQKFLRTMRMFWKNYENHKFSCLQKLMNESSLFERASERHEEKPKRMGEEFLSLRSRINLQFRHIFVTF
jgi:hypothetical protein